jgi:hypothetical protein
MSEQNDFEGRLRDAMRAEGDSAQVSPDALGKIRGRLERPRQKRSPKRVIAFGVMAAAAACTAAVIVVPQLTGPANVQSASAPESNADQESGSAMLERDASPAAPKQQSPKSESESDKAAQQAPILGELVVGKDVNVLLMAEITGDTATARLSASKWEGDKWGVQHGRVLVGETGKLKWTGSLSGYVCEFRVIQSPGKPATVRIRLAQGGACSNPYVYELDGTTLTPK